MPIVDMVGTIPPQHPGAGMPRHLVAHDDGSKPRAGIANPKWRSAMKFIVQWNGESSTQQAAIERFMKTGGRPPDNVTMLGRWHAVGAFHGVAIAEATDASALQAWVLQWSDLLSFTVAAALSDEELGALMAAHQASPK
jgi:hypothetical protein